MSGVCEICGFDRLVEQAHIIPARLNGPKTAYNILDLCPNHHRLFDRNLLTQFEFEKIAARVEAALAFHKCGLPLLDEWKNDLASRYAFYRPI